MRVSAIIPTFNRPVALKRTLETVFALCPAPDELLVVDQSDDPDPGLASVLRGAPACTTVRYLRQRPPDAQAARNQAAMASTGDILLFLDDDILLERDLLSAHLKNYDDPSVGAVGGFFLEPGEQPTERLPSHYFRPHTGWIYFPHGYVGRMDTGLFPSCNGSIRREILFRAGGFDEHYIRTQLDDTDLSCRLREMGVRIVHDPDARAYHLKEPVGGRRPGGVNEFVIADSATWQIWWYFFWTNFGMRGWRDIAIRLRRCVMRRVNFLRPWHLASALFHVVRGALRARVAVRSGRILPLRLLPADVGADRTACAS
jgi:GT2 family glycosyltransferase